MKRPIRAGLSPNPAAPDPSPYGDKKNPASDMTRGFEKKERKQ